jgi:hypothetical protein
MQVTNRSTDRTGRASDLRIHARLFLFELLKLAIIALPFARRDLTDLEGSSHRFPIGPYHDPDPVRTGLDQQAWTIRVAKTATSVRFLLRSKSQRDTGNCC